MFILTNSTISVKQHGFKPSRSTESNLALFTDYISESFELGEQIDAFYSDFSRAFDSVNHRLLFRKLSNIGVRGPALLVIESYLTGRTAQVKIKNYISSAFDVPSGVSQGSHLGPLLFFLFINDIVAVIRHLKLLIFADDAKMYKRIETVKYLADLQSEINSLVNWSRLNALDLNIGKCHIISFHKSKSQFIDQHVYKISDVKISRVNSIKDLGFYLDSNLRYSGQIDYLCSRRSKFWAF